MTTLEVNAKLLKEARRFEREQINRPVFRAHCLECPWAWQSENAAEDVRSAEDRAKAHSTIERHRVEVVFDILGQHHKTFHPTTEEVL